MRLVAEFSTLGIGFDPRPVHVRSVVNQLALRQVLHPVDCVWNVMAHAQKPDFFFRRKGRIHFYRRRRPFSRILAAEVCASEVVMLDTPCSEVVWRVLANHSIRQFPLHFPSRASPCAITFQLDYTSVFPCECNSTMLRTHFRLRVALAIRKNGPSLGTFQKSNGLRKHWVETFFHFP
jgi:hypothetical protein